MLHVFLHRPFRRLRVAITGALVALLVGALLSLFASSARAQRAPAVNTLTYVYLRNSGDTLGIEVLSRDSASVSGSLSIKGQPRIEWKQLNSSRGPGVLSLAVFAPNTASDAKPLQLAVVQMVGDSAIVAVTTATQQSRQAAGTRAGALPLVNASVLHAVLIAAHARASKASAVNVFLTSGAQTLPAAIGQSGDTLTFRLATSDMRILMAGDGMPSVILLPSQGARVVRATHSVSASAGRISYDAPANAPYVAEHVRIPSGRGYDLAATLTKPAGIAKMPVLITISGSGPQDRDGRVSVVPGYAFFRQIADTLSRRGIAVLRYDDRGVGESGGRESAINGTSADFADDVRSIIKWLRTRPDVDGARIVLAGHSEGGIIAPLVAVADAGLKGVALMAGPAYDGRRIIMFQNRESIDAAPGLTRAQRDSILKTVPAGLDSVAKSTPWMAYFLAHDPLVTLRQVKQPVLVLQGETDRQITPEQADTVQATLRRAGNRDVIMRRFPATNHLFLNDPSGAPGGYSRLTDVKVRRDVLGALADWAVRVLR